MNEITVWQTEIRILVKRGKVEMMCLLCLVLSPSREASAREFKCP